MRCRLVSIASFAAVLGSVHAFSLFIDPLETRLSSGRDRISLIYAIALVALTLAVRLFGSTPPSWRKAPALATIIGTTAAIGLLATSSTSSYLVAAVSFGVIFGGANGFGYAAALEWSADSTGRPGMAMGLTTAAYGIGATIASLLLHIVGEGLRLVTSLRVLAASILVTSIFTTLMLRRPMQPLLERRPERATEQGELRTSILWIAYGLSVLAGLMAFGHGAEILRELGASRSDRQTGVALLTLASATGGLLVALVADRTPPWRLIVILPTVAALALVVLAFGPRVTIGTVALGIVGVTYGAIIAIFPFAILVHVGPDQYPNVYGRVFTAWGAAGLLGPLLAGVLFEWTASYRVPMVIAALAALSASFVATLDIGGRVPLTEPSAR